MMNTNRDSLCNVIELIQQHELGKAIKALYKILTESPHLGNIDELQNIREAYSLMIDFMKRGYKDDKREELYLSLLQKLFYLTSNVENSWNTMNIASYVEAKSIAKDMNMSFDFIKNILESFVTDITMASLENDETRNQKTKKLYSRHNDFVNRLFNAIWISNQWSDNERNFYTELLVSPTIDVNDALLIISAISIGAINIFDKNKLLTLIEVYQRGTDERIRQRALVGLAFSQPDGDTANIFPELTDTLEKLFANKNTQRELLELQMQVFYCLNAEKDNSHIQKEIIPTLIKNNNLQITHFGIIEKEEDPMQDILHPDKADKAMEDVEKSIQQMMDMQKAGSDIYFGGFSQMKRFPFFYPMSNWLCPFYTEHPDLQSANARLEDSKFLNTLFKNGPFCDSDKYSFALALSSVIDKIPANVREMMSSSESFGPSLPVGDMQTPAYIRRMYLQDLYRFYKLYHKRTGLINPFENTFTGMEFRSIKAFFFASTLFRSDFLTESKLSLGRFLMKQQRWSEVNDLLLSFNGNIPDTNAEYYILAAYADLNDSLYGMSIEMFRKALEIEPENVMALKGMARASLIEGDYDSAEKTYATLVRLFPTNKNFIKNYAITLLKSNRTTEAMEILYKIDYESPDDISIKRILAWGLLCQNKPEIAKKEYDKILSLSDYKKEDCLNAGYCAWFLGDIVQATESFKSFIQMSNDEGNTLSLKTVFIEDCDIIYKYGITDTDIQLVIDMVEE